jgi:homocysteine S-methyltransferase
LNELTTLDAGDPVAFGDWHRDVGRLFPQLCVIGGCCGTDQRHVEAAWRAFRQPAR